MKKMYFVCLLMLTALEAVAQDNQWPSFLERDQRPDGVLYLPAPPDTLSAEFVGDIAWHQWGRRQRTGERAEQARREASMGLPSMLRFLSEPVGMELSEEKTPEVAYLVSRVITDGSGATSKAKRHYNRKRPFLFFGDGTLIPEEEATHHTPSYPSSHSAAGWALALVMAELVPDRQEQILKWGFEYGQSRIIAGYHYHSDVEAARLAASAVVARLHADEAFQKQMKKAKKEILCKQSGKAERRE